MLGASLIALVGGAMAGAVVVVELGLLGLLLLLAARVWCVANLRRLRLRRSLPTAVFCGADFDFELELANGRRWLAARDVLVSDRFLPFHDRGVSIGVLPAGEIERQRFVARVVARGPIDGVGYRLQSSFPFGLFVLALRRRGRARVLAYPRPVLPEALRATGFDSAEDDAAAAAFADREGELRGVREFQRGDPLKEVAWRAFARTGKLAVREHDRPLPERYALVFHSYCPPGKVIWSESFEHALSLVAGLLCMARDQGMPVELLAPFTAWRRMEVRGDMREALEALALAEHEPAPSLEAVSAALRDLPGDHPVFVVSEAPLDLWADRLPDLGRNVTCLDNRSLRMKRAVLTKFRKVA